MLASVEATAAPTTIERARVARRTAVPFRESLVLRAYLDDNNGTRTMPFV